MLELIALILSSFSIALTIGIYLGELRVKVNIMRNLFTKLIFDHITRQMRTRGLLYVLSSYSLTEKGLSLIPDELKNFLKSISHKFRKYKDVYEIALILGSKYGHILSKYVNPEISLLELTLLCAIYINQLLKESRK